MEAKQYARRQVRQSQPGMNQTKLFGDVCPRFWCDSTSAVRLFNYGAEGNNRQYACRWKQGLLPFRRISEEFPISR